MIKYKKYKPSGIQWIGEIPEQWKVSKLRYFISKNDGGVWGNDGGQIYVLRSTEINIDGRWNFKNEPAKRDLTEAEIKKALLFEGDLLITKSSGSELHIGKTALVNKKISEMKCCFSNFMQRIRLKDNMTPTLFSYFFNSILAREQYNYLSNTTTGLANLSSELISNILIPIPQPEEQTTIANYLDKKTAQIDELISKKEQLLKLYEEVKTVIINQAVTKGLNLTTPMKDSGIEWLGEIPEHWAVKKIKFFLKGNRGALKTGPFGSQLKNNDLNPLGKYKVYTQRNVLDLDSIKGEDRIDDEKFNSLKEFEIKPKDILFTTRGSIGKCFILPYNVENGILHPCLIRIQINENIVLLEWVFNYVNFTSFFIENVKLESNSTIIDVIYGGTLKEIYLPIPPLKEQQALILFIGNEITSIATKAEKTKKLIELLKEYRTALISEAVTGKIKVF